VPASSAACDTLRISPSILAGVEHEGDFGGGDRQVARPITSLSSETSTPSGADPPLASLNLLGKDGNVTVVVAVAAPDGIVLAAESRLTITMGDRHRIVSDSAQKVFPIAGQVGVLTYGAAFLGAQTIAGVLDEFDANISIERRRKREAEDGDDGIDILWGEEVATDLGAFFDARVREVVDPEVIAQFEEQEKVLVGFLVAGHDVDGIGRIREVTVPGPVIEELPYTTATMGAAWRGQTDVIRRLVWGFDGDVFATLGVEVSEEATDAFGKLSYTLLFPTTMQDGVDFASFLIRTTIDMQRFSDGTQAAPGEVPGCGGPIRILAVTLGGTEWVTEPHLTADSKPGAAIEGAGGS
jgi:hypothetical protein